MTHASSPIAVRLASHWYAAMLAAVVSAVPAYADDADDIRAAFDRYRQAALTHDGAAAAGLVTPGSLDHYQRLRDLALRGPRSEVEALPMADRLLVFRMRHEFTAVELQPMSGADLIRTSIEEAWSAPKVLVPLTITSVAVVADAAVATPTRAGDPVPIRLLFRPSAGGWQLDLVELARGADTALEEALRFRANRAKVDLDTVTRWAIEDTSGHLVDKDLWVPLMDKAS